jgi:hypothetical protein
MTILNVLEKLVQWKKFKPFSKFYGHSSCGK